MTIKGRALSEGVTAPRLKLLAKLKDDGPQKLSQRYVPLRWALDRGLVRREQELFAITPEGLAKHSYAEMDAGLKRAIKAITKLVGKILVRTSSDAEEAVVGGGFLYHTEPDHKPFPPGAARALIANGLVVGRKDGLLEGVAQSFRLPTGV